MSLFLEYFLDLVSTVGSPFILICILSIIISGISGFLKLSRLYFVLTWSAVFLLLIIANNFSVFGEFLILHPLDSIDFLANQFKLLLAYYLIILLVIGRKHWSLASKFLSAFFGIFSILFMIYPILSPLFSLFAFVFSVSLTLLESIARINIWSYEKIMNYNTKNEDISQNLDLKKINLELNHIPK